MNKCLLLVFGCLFYATTLVAQSASDIVVPVTVSTTTNPPSITLNFPATTNAVSTLIGRKFINQTSWSYIVLPANATSFTDNNVLAGIGFEYIVIKQTSVAPTTRVGLVYAGIEAPALAYRGKMILVVDDTLSSPLAMELDRLVQDLRGDGWQVLRRDIDVATSSVPSVKTLLRTLYDQDPDNTVCALLFGNIPVPYSGNINPDAHPEHLGAWPTDYYYGDMNETAWTDTLVNNAGADRPANRNVPGDGKFDQSQTPTLAEIVVSRVDFSNLSGWDVSQTELYRRYLNKNHDFRTGAFKPANQTLIDDNFFFFGGEAFSQNGWRNGYALTGTSSIVQGDFFNDTDDNQSFLIGYGCGGGNYMGAGGVGSSNNFKVDTVNVVFSMLFGSYFGDWDFEINPFMPSALASKGGILSCSWAGRPNWHLHHMGLGEPILTSTFWVWLNSFLANPVYPPNFGDDLIHVGLLGDPTLRAHAVRPPEDVAAAASCEDVTLGWKASPDAALGYLIYRAPSLDSIFELIVNAPVAGTTYVDTLPLNGMNFYQVKAFKLEMVPTGSYYNQSIGTPTAINFIPTPITATATATNISCNGNADGAINLTVSGGANYTFLWSNGSTSQNLSGLTAGDYTVTVTEIQGCTTTAGATITEPAAISLDADATDVSCFGLSDGSISLSVGGGVPPFAYSWSNGSSAQNQTDLAAGSYAVTATDDNGCTKTASATVVEPDELILTLTPEDAACNGDSNGSISLDIAGGTPDYSYAWSNGAGSQNLDNVPAGTYTATVTDANGCTRVESAVVGEPPAITTATSVTNAGCAGATNGAIDLTVSGGTPGYTFQWSNGSTNEDLTNVGPGTYTVTVTDDAGCTKTSSATVGQTTTLTVGTAAINATCFGKADGTASAIASGGSPGYTYLWSNGQTSPTITDLVAGSYTVTVTDNVGCTATGSAAVGQPAPVLAQTTFMQTSCPDIMPVLGNVLSVVSGGTPGYTYLWSNGATTPDLQNVPAGNYTVTVQDANACSAVHSNMVFLFILPWDVDPTINAVSCNGGTDGSIVLNVSGANGAPYTYQWSNGATTKNILSIPAGTYTVTITDADGCTTSESFSVSQPPEIVTQFTGIADASCPEACDGQATLIIFYNTIPPTFADFNFSWGDGSQDSARSDLCFGSSSVTITDANGCSQTANIVIGSALPPIVSVVGNDTVCINGPELYSLPGNFTNYQWFASGNGVISQGQGTAQVSVFWPAGGSFTLTGHYSYAPDCVDSAQISVFVVGCVSTGEPGLPGVRIQPNPFGDWLTVLFERPIHPDARLSLFDMQGRLMAEQSTLTETTRLETSRLPAGAYSLQIMENGRIGVWKVVKVE